MRVKFEIPDEGNGSLIADFRLTGDFFLHPEDALPHVECAISGLPWPSEEDVYIDAIQQVLDEKKAVFIGISPLDISQAILSAAKV